MCAALTVPIIKDGYRLYPGMPVSGNSASKGDQRSSSNQHAKSQKTKIQHGILIPQGRMSPMDSTNGSSPPRNGLRGGSPNHHVFLQPRNRTSSNQSDMSARSSFDVAPSTYRPDLIRGRSAMSTSQLYMQQRRELAIQQQLRRQELAKKQQLQQQTKGRKSSSPAPSHPPLAQRMDSNGNDSCKTDYDAEDSLNFCDRMRKTSTGDHNNNKEMNPLRKLLKRLGLGNTTNGPANHQRSESSSFSENSIEQAMPALAVSAKN